MRGRLKDDAETFAILEAFDQGLTGTQVAKMFDLPSRASALAIKTRISMALRETEEGDPDPRRHDGTLPYGWWREGLARQCSTA